MTTIQSVCCFSKDALLLFEPKGEQKAFLFTSNVNIFGLITRMCACVEQSGLSPLFVCLSPGVTASSAAWSFHHFKTEQQPLLYLTSRTWFKHVFKITYEHEADLITWSRFGVGLIQCPRGLFQYGRMGTNADRSAVLSVRRGMSLFPRTPSSSFPPSFVIIFRSLSLSLPPSLHTRSVFERWPLSFN